MKEKNWLTRVPPSYVALQMIYSSVEMWEISFGNMTEISKQKSRGGWRRSPQQCDINFFIISLLTTTKSGLFLSFLTAWLVRVHFVPQLLG